MVTTITKIIFSLNNKQIINMSKQTQLNIGLFGFGVVGESLWQV